MTAILTDLEGFPTFSESEVASDHSVIIQTPRREVCWVGLDEANQSLESIKRCFEDCLDRFLLSPSISPLRHINASKANYTAHNPHPCSGYLRVEIALTSDISKGAIVSHSFPSQGERCSICRQIVRYSSSKEKPGNSLFNGTPSAQSTIPQSYPEFCDEEMEFTNMPNVEGDCVSTFETPQCELVVGSLLNDVEILDSPQIDYTDEPLFVDEEGERIGSSTIEVTCSAYVVERGLEEETGSRGNEVEADALMVC